MSIASNKAVVLLTQEALEQRRQVEFDREEELRKAEKERREDEAEMNRVTNAVSNGFIQAALIGLLSNRDSKFLCSGKSLSQMIEDLADSAVVIGRAVQHYVDDEVEASREDYCNE